MADDEQYAAANEEEEEEEDDESETDLDESFEPEELPESFRQPDGAADESQITAPPDGEKKKKEPDPNPLTIDQLYGNSLCMLEPIGEGLSCAYVRMDVPNRKITDIAMLEKYIHLRFLDVSQNYLQDITPISAITHLVSVNASKNRLRNLHLEAMPFLQTANFASNKLTTLEGLSHPHLEKLNMSSNRIRRLRFPDTQCLVHLRILDLRGNKLETLEGTYPPNLEELYVPSNLIKTIGKTEGLEKLKILHARDNQIENLDGIDQCNLKSLTYLNLRGNSLEEVKELKKLRSIGTITDIILDGNPITDSDDYMDMTLGAMGVSDKIQRLDKHKITEEDRVYAKEAMIKIDSEPEGPPENGFVIEDIPETADKSTDAELSFSLSANISEQ